MSKELRNLRAKHFLNSALTKTGMSDLDSFRKWYSSTLDLYKFSVQKIPLEKVKNWSVDPETGNVTHNTGKFFKIVGLNVETNFGTKSQWNQPIIVQPEIGILGFIIKKIDGIIHFLIQAKMEPGNVNILQISPTVQATRSNYTSVHGGRKPLYIEYFLDSNRGNVIIDQLQSEQGSRYLAKRNRNIIVEVAEHELKEIQQDFYWLTLGQLFELLKENNLVNMDSRTVLSSIQFYNDLIDPIKIIDEKKLKPFQQEIIKSYFAPEDKELHDFDELVSWFTQLKSIYELKTTIIPLNEVKEWAFSDGIIRHQNNKYFQVVGVDVQADRREVNGWQQPLVESSKGGIICFLCQKHNGILHFLVQARMEPGNFDIFEMAPSVQFTPQNYADSKSYPNYSEFITKNNSKKIRFDTVQSEEGGRFYHDQNRYLVIELEEHEKVVLIDNYKWLTLRQLKEFVRFNNYVNIEARGLLSCLGFS